MAEYLRRTWRELGRSLFEGERYTRNMRGITLVAVLLAAVNAVTGFINLRNGYYHAAATAPAFILAGLIILYFTLIRKQRTGAVVTAILAVVAVFTYEVFFVSHSFPIFWTMLLPLAFCYLAGVKQGLFLSLYFMALYWVLFSTPLRELAAARYSDVIAQRFPILYTADVVLTACIMVQYHRTTLKLMDNAESLLQAKENADRANASKSDFLANMSHEIRTPINAVLGMNEMILREAHGVEEKAGAGELRAALQNIGRYAGDAESAGHNLLAIVNDILDLSKIEAGRMELAEGEYQLSSVLNDVCGMTLFKAGEKGLDFRVDADETLPDGLFGDKVRVRQVITNLLNNAVKYTDRGSVRLILRGEGERQPGETLLLRITVEDTGIGIRPEDQDKLFTKFQRLDLEQNSTVEGTGLGLAITGSLLQLMGGWVEVESEYGKGSTFTAKIPQRVVYADPMGDFRERFRQSMQEAPAYRESFRAPDAAILIVDDTRMNLTVAAGLLKNTGVQLRTAAGGAEAVELAEKERFDLILLDQRMPGMDGTETLRRIRALEWARAVPVICLTADAVMGARERYLAEGFTDYLTKPIDSMALERMLMKYLPAEKVQSGGAEEREAVPEPMEYASLRSAGLSPELGLRYCGEDRDFYVSILQEYAHSGREKLWELQNAFEAGNRETYAILAHTLKSTSRTVGAEDLSEQAARLEAAANAGDTAALQAEHGALLERYSDLLTAILAVFPEETSAAGEEEVLEFYPEE